MYCKTRFITDCSKYFWICLGNTLSFFSSRQLRRTQAWLVLEPSSCSKACPRQQLPSQPEPGKQALLQQLASKTGGERKQFTPHLWATVQNQEHATQKSPPVPCSDHTPLCSPASKHQQENLQQVLSTSPKQLWVLGAGTVFLHLYY